MHKKIIVALVAVIAFSSVAFAVSSNFSDVPADHWAADAIMWNNEAGVMKGPGEMPGMFDPAGLVNRAQLAAVNQRMYKYLVTRIEDLETKVAELEAKIDAMTPVEETLDTIAMIAEETADLSTLVDALTAGELLSVFEDEEADYTVFAPTNDAFADIQSTVDDLLLPENLEDLQNVLKYHVVDGSYMAADLTDGLELTTLQGDTLAVEVMDDDVYVGGALVTTADVEASNGVVHIIDTVLVPTS